MLKKSISIYLLLLLSCALFLGGCSTILAPPYDKVLVDGLNEINSDIMKFFASIPAGTKSETFNQRNESYTNLIGRLDALQIQANARPEPNMKVMEKANKFLEKRGIPVLDDSIIPSAYAIQQISKTITKMRKTDQKQGITATEAELFKSQVVIYLDQALTYENFLNR